MSHPNEHLIVYVPDHADRAQALLLWQDRDKPRIKALVRAFGAGAQLAESTGFAIITGATLDAAEGATLDRWGELVGERRGGLDVEDFRRFIELRIRVNTEHPGTDEMWEVVDAAVDPSTVRSYLVADGIIYLVTSADWLPDSIVAHAAGLVRDFRPMSYYAAVVEQVEGEALEIGTVLEPGSTIGSIADPSGTIGRLIYPGRD